MDDMRVQQTAGPSTRRELRLVIETGTAFLPSSIGPEDRDLKLDIAEYEEEPEKEGKIVHQPLIVEMKYGPIRVRRRQT